MAPVCGGGRYFGKSASAARTLTRPAMFRPYRRRANVCNGTHKPSRGDYFSARTPS